MVIMSSASAFASLGPARFFKRRRPSIPTFSAVFCSLALATDNSSAVSAAYSALLSSSYFERINDDDDDDEYKMRLQLLSAYPQFL